MRDDVPVYILSRDGVILSANASMADLLRKIVAKHEDAELRERLDILAEVRANGQYLCTLGDAEYRITSSKLKDPIAW